MPRRSRQASREAARARSLASAGNQLALARARVAEARRAMAANSAPSDPPLIVGHGWKWAERLIARHREFLESHPDVIGFGFGHRSVAGQLTDERVLTVYVRAKRPTSEIGKSRRLPKALSYGGRTLAIDVVQSGDALELHLSSGAGIGAGDGDSASRGTLGSFAIASNGRTVAITAMHVTGAHERPPGSPITITAPSRRDDPGAAIVARVGRGTRTNVDAARLELEPGTAIDWNTPAFRIKGWRRVHWPGDHLTRVRLFGARSGFISGHIRNANVSLPQYGLADAIIASIPTARGDSGAAIVDDEGLVLGFLAGRGNEMPEDLRVFCPASLVLRTLDCVIPNLG